MRLVDILRELQETDTQLENARLTLAQLRLEIGERSALDRANQEVSNARAELHRVDAAQRVLDLEAESIRTKIAGEEKKLYSGSITNPRELGSLGDEIAQEKRRLGLIEDRLLELMDSGERATQLVTELETKLSQQTENWNGGQARAQRLARELETGVEGLTGRRDALAAQVDAPIRAQYDTLRRQKGGIAVAPVLQRTCQACRVGLTPALEQRARIGAELVPCHSCGRLLYIPIS